MYMLILYLYIYIYAHMRILGNLGLCGWPPIEIPIQEVDEIETDEADKEPGAFG